MILCIKSKYVKYRMFLSDLTVENIISIEEVNILNTILVLNTSQILLKNGYCFQNEGLYFDTLFSVCDKYYNLINRVVTAYIRNKKLNELIDG